MANEINLYEKDLPSLQLRGTSVDSTEGKDEGDEGDGETSHHAMKIEGNIEGPPPQTKETNIDLSAQVPQLQ